jgi:transcriptional regulator with GAF, ATPase, and Fis domain
MPKRLLIIGSQDLASKMGFDRLLPHGPGFRCEYVSWETLALERLSVTGAELVVALAVEEPRSLARWLRDRPLVSPTLAVLPSAADEDLLRLASETVDDFVLWPGCEGELRQRLARMLGSHNVESVHLRLTREMGMAQLVGQDPAFVATLEAVPLLAASAAPVLLCGETGTGKELFARAIHHLSRREGFPFIPVECGALPDHLAENEIFGHVRGAFTDAHADQKGLAAMAEGGTLFLDEVDALSLAAQAKLLRFLEDGAYRALGADRFTRANVRLIAATNRDLESCVREKQFRSDLYFRLNVLQLRLPPLRDRRGDINLLARHFLESCCAATGARRKSFSSATLNMLEIYSWPGNVRELYNVVQRAVVFCPGTQILPNHISLPAPPQASSEVVSSFRQARRQAIESFERHYVREMLRKHRGNVTRAAFEAGKDRRAFGRLVKKYSVDRNAF